MNWTTIWSQAAAPSFAMGMLQGKKKTVVFPVSSPVSGERVRLRFSNIYGKKPDVIGAADGAPAKPLRGLHIAQHRTWGDAADGTIGIDFHDGVGARDGDIDSLVGLESFDTIGDDAR